MGSLWVAGQNTGHSDALPLVGERELLPLLREHEEARATGLARVVFVRGPSGVGKGALLGALRQSLVHKGVAVLEGGARTHLRGTFGLFRELVPELLAQLAESGVPSRVLSELQRRTAPLRGGAHPGGEDPRLDLADAVAELFSLASRTAPAFLLTDLESADRASLELLRYVLAALRAPGATTGGLWVLSYRDDQPLPAPLVDVVEKVSGRVVALRGLDLEGIRSYLARKDVAERLLSLTGGLPAVLEQVISGPPEAAPEDLFLRRVLRLPQAEQDALHVLAVATEPASAEELGAVVVRSRGQAPLDLNVRLHRLVESHLLTVHPSRGEDRFAFAREADRERLVGALQPKDLVGLHLGWGHELRRRKAEPERVARHLMTADPAGEGWLAACEAATVLASRLAHDDAVDLLLKAVPHAPLDQRGGLHQRLAEWHRALADYPGALKHAGLWRKHLPADQKRLARAESARLLVLMGRLSTAEKVLRRVLGDAPAPVGTDAASARAFTDFAELRFLRGAYPEALGHAERAAAALQGQPELLLGLRNTVGKVHLAQGAYEQAHQAFAENHAAAKELGLGREAAQALLNQGVVAHRRGDKRAAIALYRAALPDLDRKGQAHALSNLGSLYAESGDFEPAVEHLSRALLAFSRARRNKEIAHCSGNLARLSLFLGDLGRAEELSEHMAVVAGQVGDPYLQASAGLIAAELAEARSQHPVALDGYRRARAGFEHLQSPRYAAEAALGAARSALLLGERAEARLALVSDALDQLAPKVASLGAERELVLGDLALLVGDLSEATRRLSRAKEILLAEPDLEGPYRVYALLSRLRLQAGDAVGAQAELGRATRLLEELVSRVPLQRRADFLKLPRRAQVLAASAEREITPARVQRALDLGQEPRAEATAAIVGNCEPVQRVLRQLGPVSRSQATVLIRGESGTGKELIAEAIHLGSQRRDLPLIKVNCAALPEELLMSELFGHEKGAFTGAVRERKGRFELAEGGTIFLDEIGDISPKAQVALLRVLQEREFERVGGSKTIKVDVRVVCATHRDLEAMIARGTFRQDLYYRLKGVMLALPSLRERMEDLPLLVEHLLAKVAAERKEPVKSLSPEAFELVRRYDWPGNIRELENVLSSASLFAPGRLIALESFEHLPELRTLARTAAPQPVVVAAAPAVLLASAAPAAATQVGAAAASGPLDYFELARQRNLSLKDLRHEVETQCISRALQEAKGNISEAARLLKMKRSRLSQIVNAESVLRSQVKGEASPDAGDGLADEMEGD